MGWFNGAAIKRQEQEIVKEKTYLEKLDQKINKHIQSMENEFHNPLFILKIELKYSDFKLVCDYYSSYYLVINEYTKDYQITPEIYLINLDYVIPTEKVITIKLND